MVRPRFSHTYLEGTYSEVYPHITRDTEGLKKTLYSIFIPGWHTKSRISGMSRIHS
ncbi:MAG: hypothetical protein U5N26_12390 [Candidatus Marinimicrobia bacterium]|nr:hypothetical protein [Candidatus Neomarinimicrobiota bacterium]